ncbi:NAD(+) diphosphatase [Gallaecimonas xiamenensis]|uniref:NAD-capped RNA hydrolase NudC n=1 Tax=Gallaecimonas xiamenensis 3-C-1 TaxID=745411 RepID=K2JRS6_9GAMM|nr:NAD(+) diphosphatase [Gallaecimonas xiamenensis]EKE77182.1 NADH pyrophosphatase [Gallaecimonas xiamenensis 3-C-1]
MSELYLTLQSHQTEAVWLLVRGEQLWFLDGALPQGTKTVLPPFEAEGPAVLVGQWQGRPALMLEWPERHQDPKFGEFGGLRPLLMPGQEALFQLAGRGVQLANFFRTHRYCGQCGARMRVVQEEIATHCDRCQHRCYPRLSPSMIVAVKKGRQLLLGSSPRHKNGMYSTLAGFTEPGESMEETVRREVMEEVGLEVTNIRYVCSQNWPFPHSMMVGFIADYHSGDIQIDPLELTDAQWFDLDALPLIPPAGTIARRLIDQAIDEIEKER